MQRGRSVPEQGMQRGSSVPEHSRVSAYSADATCWPKLCTEITSVVWIVSDLNAVDPDAVGDRL